MHATKLTLVIFFNIKNSEISVVFLQYFSSNYCYYLLRLKA